MSPEAWRLLVNRIYVMTVPGVGPIIALIQGND